MNLADKRFKVNSLIQLARTTTNDDRRERYVVEAEEILNSMELTDLSSLEKFFYDVCVIDESGRVERPEVYKAYVDFCKKEKLTVSTRNALYYFLRENNVGECRVKGNSMFKMRIISKESEE